MAYQTGTSTGVLDLMSKLLTFAVANGWTQDESSSGRMAIHKSTVYISFRWDTSSPNVVGLYHALGWVSSTDPGNHTDDSGQGVISGANNDLDNGRSVALGTGSFPSYHFFEDDTYIHVVVEYASGQFRHFGFGIIEKVGDDWTGGEYCYGHHHLNAGSASAIKGSTAVLLDGLTSSLTYRPYAATMHAEGLPGPAGTIKWAVVWGDGGDPGDDRAANDRIRVQGGFRAGPVAQSLGHFAVGSEAGLVPMYQIANFFVYSTSVVFLGTQPDVRGVNIRYFTDAEEVTIGGDTWVLFPTHLKSNVVDTGGTKNQGIAYKKVVT